MGRPRTKNLDLPAGLLFNPKTKAYCYREAHGARKRHNFGAVPREEAIKAYAKLTSKRVEAMPTTDGTISELIERYILEEMPRRVRLKLLKQITADEYLRQSVKLHELFGAQRYARTPAQSADPDVFRRADVITYLRRFEGVRGAVLANRMVALLSVVFENANDLGVCTFNPCMGVERNKSKPRKNILPEQTVSNLLTGAHPGLQLIARFAQLTAWRKTDIRNLTLPQIRDGVIYLTQSKTGKKQEWEVTPALQAVLFDAAKLKGRNRGIYVFPNRKGLPYTESALQSAWKRAKVKNKMEGVDAVFRDFRTTEINEVKRLGGDATEVAGHADKRTTERHYLEVVTRIKGRR